MFVRIGLALALSATATSTSTSTAKVHTTATATVTSVARIPATATVQAPAQPPVGGLPGSSAKIVAKLAGRPVQLTSYMSSKGKPSRPELWAWDSTKRKFALSPFNSSVAVSPDERWVATQLGGRSDKVPQLTFLDRKTGKSQTIDLPVPTYAGDNGDQYHQTIWPTWSPDSRQMLLNVFEPGFEPRSWGIVLVDVPTLKARFVPIRKALITVGGFQWTHDSTGVVARWGKNGASSVRLYDLKGAVRRTWNVRGRPAGEGWGTFSPSGRRFVTACTSLEKAACVWDTATGKAVTQIGLGFSASWGTVLGWYDDKHLIASTDTGAGVVDLKGKVVETLVKADKSQGFRPYFAARGRP
ncbi:hypothetical protein AB0M44_47495 [Streptosporangium subroseum]|uniref:hypothetical protein n=1 Tax=Streptosporangium subroseum TaxID=106412 RepID=UPI00342E71A4